MVSLIYIRTLPKMRFINLLPSRQESVYADDFMFKLITAIPTKRQGDKEVALARRLPLSNFNHNISGFLVGFGQIIVVHALLNQSA